MSTIAPISAHALHDTSILIVDDEASNVRLLARILTNAGFAGVCATSDSREALRLFAEVEPDLILLDLRMPELDGFAILEQLRSRIDATDFLPVLAMTGDTSPETRHRALVAGAKDFLEKPFQAHEVIARVENLLTTRLLHRSLEQKVRERTAELELALAAARAASEAKSQFLATMSHELRTPLNSVIGFANHLHKNRAGNLLPKDLAYLVRIRENGTSLLTSINDILDLSRIEAGKMVVEHTPVSLDLAIRELIDQMVSASPNGVLKVAARVCLPSGLRPLITDNLKLRRILGNLIGNAAKFTMAGHILVGVKADADGRPLRIDVVDSGIGVPAERLAAIFDAFEQADNSTQRQFGGTGLGLAICRTMCELLGYRIRAVSEPGIGTGFSVLLDAATEGPASYAELASSYAEDGLVCA